MFRICLLLTRRWRSLAPLHTRTRVMGGRFMRRKFSLYPCSFAAPFGARSVWVCVVGWLVLLELYKAEASSFQCEYGFVSPVPSTLAWRVGCAVFATVHKQFVYNASIKWFRNVIYSVHGHAIHGAIRGLARLAVEECWCTVNNFWALQSSEKSFIMVITVLLHSLADSIKILTHLFLNFQWL